MDAVETSVCNANTQIITASHSIAVYFVVVVVVVVVVVIVVVVV